MKTVCKVCGDIATSARSKYCDRCRPRSKHGAKATVIHGRRFASKKEAARWTVLCAMAEAGLISKLQYQPRFPIAIGGVHVCTYVADFTYHGSDGKLVIEDVKSKWTAKNPVYVIKKKLMMAVLKLTISEII